MRFVFWFLVNSIIGNTPLPKEDAPPIIVPIKKTKKVILSEVKNVQPIDGPMCSDDIYLDAIEPPTYMGVLLEETASEQERIALNKAITTCNSIGRASEKTTDPYLGLALLRLEKELDTPPGLLLSTWCIEVSMKDKGRHDGLFYGDILNGVYRASGPFQLHENVWNNSCNGTSDAPHDLLWAARCYYSRVLEASEKAKKMTSCKKGFLHIGEAAISNIRKYGWSCNAKSKHWKLMEMMKLK